MNNINKVLEEFDEKFGNFYGQTIADKIMKKLDSEEIKQFITKAIQDRDAEIIEKIEKGKAGLYNSEDFYTDKTKEKAFEMLSCLGVEIKELLKQ